MKEISLIRSVNLFILTYGKIILKFCYFASLQPGNVLKDIIWWQRWFRFPKPIEWQLVRRKFGCNLRTFGLRSKRLKVSFYRISGNNTNSKAYSESCTRIAQFELRFSCSNYSCKIPKYCSTKIHILCLLEIFYFPIGISDLKCQSRRQYGPSRSSQTWRFWEVVSDYSLSRWIDVINIIIHIISSDTVDLL